MTASDDSLPDRLEARPSAELPVTDAIVIVVDRCGVVRFATPDAAHYLGTSPSDVVGRSVLDYIAADERESVTALWHELLNTPDRVSGELVVTPHERLEHAKPLRVSMWELPHGDGFLLLFHLSDHIRDRLETLYSILAALSSTLKLDEVFDVVLAETLRLIPCDHCALLVFDREGTLKLARSVGSPLELPAPNDRNRLFERATIRALRSLGHALIIPDCERDPRWEKRPSPAPVRSWLGAPLIHRGEFLGALNLDSLRPDFFTPEDAALAQALATQIAAAISTARQYENELHRADRFRAVSEVSLAISRLDLTSVLEVVYRKISSLMDTSSFFIGLYDAETEKVHIVGSYEHGVRIPDAMQPAEEGLAGLVLHTGARLIIHDSEVEPLPEVGIIDGEKPRSLLMFPLLAQEKPVGVISVQSYRPHAYTQSDIALLETMAGSVATAIDNAQLYDATADQLIALETLHQMSLQLASVQDRERVAELILDAVLELFGPAEVCLYLSGDPSQEPALWEGCLSRGDGQRTIRQGNPATGFLANQIAETGQPVVLHDVGVPPGIARARQRPTQALAGYPLARGGATLGALVLLYDRPHFFRATTLRTLELLCMQAATALENAYYYQRLRGRLDEVSALHDLAREVSNTDSLDEMLRLVTQRIRDVYDCHSASIALYDPASNQIVTRTAVGISADHLAQARFAPGEFVAGHVVATGEVVYVADTRTEARFRVIDPDIRSLLAVPLKAHDQVIGSMSIDSASPEAFTPDHERLLTIAGGQLAAAIETLRLLEEARERAAQLDEANKTLRAVDALRDELVQNVSHELRSPLALIKGYVGLMRDGELGAVTADQIGALDTIESKAESISRLINDILSLETIQRGTLTLGPVDMAALAEQAVRSARLVHAGHNFELVCELVNGASVVEGDNGRLTQVIDNLLGNAVKFSLPGSTVTVRLRPGPDACAVTLDVADEGIGIPADKLAHIFERFYQVDHGERGHRGGAGLGLSIVQRILEAHGGTIAVSSTEGQGSVFTCTLPLVCDEAGADA